MGSPSPHFVAQYDKPVGYHLRRDNDRRGARDFICDPADPAMIAP